MSIKYESTESFRTNCQINYQTVLRRIDAGWTLERALTEIPKPRGKI